MVLKIYTVCQVVNLKIRTSHMKSILRSVSDQNFLHSSAELQSESCYYYPNVLPKNLPE